MWSKDSGRSYLSQSDGLGFGLYGTGIALEVAPWEPWSSTTTPPMPEAESVVSWRVAEMVPVTGFATVPDSALDVSCRPPVRVPDGP